MNASIVTILDYICPALFFVGAVDWIFSAIGRARPDWIEGLERRFLALFEDGRPAAWFQASIKMMMITGDAIWNLLMFLERGAAVREEGDESPRLDQGGKARWPGFLSLVRRFFGLYDGFSTWRSYALLGAVVLVDVLIASSLVIAASYWRFIDPFFIAAGALALGVSYALIVLVNDPEFLEGSAWRRLALIFKAIIWGTLHAPLLITTVLPLIVFPVVIVMILGAFLFLIGPLMVTIFVVLIIDRLNVSASIHDEPGVLSAGFFYVGGISMILGGLCEFILK